MQTGPADCAMQALTEWIRFFASYSHARVTTCIQLDCAD